MKAHGESIVDIPSHVKCKIWGNSSACPYEIISWTTNVISTQGHPEFDVDVMVHKIIPMAKQHGYLTDPQLEQANSTFTDVDAEKNVQFVASFLEI